MILSIWVRKGKPGELELIFPYYEEYIAKVREIPGRKWDKDNKKWLIPNCDESIKKLQELFADGELVFGKSISDPSGNAEAEADHDNEQFLGAMQDTLKLKGYSPKTTKSYMSHIRLFLKHLNKNADLVNQEDINEYLLYLLGEQQASHSYVNQAVNSIKFLYNKLKDNQFTISVVRPKRENKLPEVLSQKDVLKILIM